MVDTCEQLQYVRIDVGCEFLEYCTAQIQIQIQRQIQFQIQTNTVTNTETNTNTVCDNDTGWVRQRKNLEPFQIWRKTRRLASDQTRMSRDVGTLRHHVFCPRIIHTLSRANFVPLSQVVLVSCLLLALVSIGTWTIYRRAIFCEEGDVLQIFPSFIL